MVNEDQVEPDFYIDRAEDAVYVPLPRGLDKWTNLNDRKDDDLFDFNLEAEPILQVLVGKALELARIEVIETFEKQERYKHNARYKKERNSELLYTQQQEAKQARINLEVDMRQVQDIAQKEDKITTEKKVLSRIVGKNYLANFKKATLSILVDSGILRDLRQTDFEYALIPNLFQKIGILKEQNKEN